MGGGKLPTGLPLHGSSFQDAFLQLGHHNSLNLYFFQQDGERVTSQPGRLGSQHQFYR